MEGRIFCKKFLPLWLKPTAMIMSITDAITAQIESAQQGDVFFVSDFAKSGNDVFISRILSELVDKGKLDRLAIGIYYKPQSTDFGLLKPSVDQIVKAIARRDHAQISAEIGRASCRERV